MSNQNIYDNQAFFNGYFALRGRDDCYNNLLEQPAIAELLRNLNGKTGLDLGCGYGHNCIDFVRRGAKRIVGLDISGKMLAVARRESCDDKVEYINRSMTEIAQLNEKFDFVYSSLAFHYIEDFTKLIHDIYAVLHAGGWLLYSQEHPIVTATRNGEGHFNRDAYGNPVSYTFSNYNQGGKREFHWFIDGVVNYHRPMGELLTTIAKAGFMIEEVVEPVPKAWAVEKLPSLTKEFLNPNFLIIKAKKR